MLNIAQWLYAWITPLTTSHSGPSKLQLGTQVNFAEDHRAICLYFSQTGPRKLTDYVSHALY